MTKTTVISVYEQECHGKIQYRVMREDGGTVFGGHHQVDFETEEDAVSAIRGDFRRERRGDVIINGRHIDRQANGRRTISVVLWPPCDNPVTVVTHHAKDY